MVSYLERNLLGPRNGAKEEVEGSPLLQYMMGMLFPQGVEGKTVADRVGAGADDSDRTARVRSEEDADDATLSATDDLMPSAFSISFLIEEGASLDCAVSGARYEKAEAPSGRRGRAQQRWMRVPLPSVGEGEVVRLSRTKHEAKVFGGLASVSSKWRARSGAQLVTVTLKNLQRGNAFDVDRIIFQAALSCSVAGGSILPYPVPRTFKDAGREDEEYLYRASVPYARGHGCAADWTKEGGEVRQVRATFIPKVDVPLADFTLPNDIRGIDDRSLDLGFLSRIVDDPKAVISALDGFTKAYRGWIERERTAAGPTEARAVHLAAVAERWVVRMEKSIVLLQADPLVRRAFGMANRAMGIQMLLAKNLRALADSGRKISPTEGVSPPEVTDLSGLRWRPFQVAYFLGLVESLWNPESRDRNDVDVIWFPTGGGKTEAYLLVAAFELLRRRLLHQGKDVSTAILSRYTLRMLTAQQFQRTAALMVALELLRMEDASALGTRSFSLGLWVGESLTPNLFSKAREQLDNLQKNRGSGTNPFLVDRCPRCGVNLFHPDVDSDAHWGASATASSFSLHCPRSLCEFHGGLPLNVVDQALYQSPPSILIGTVDKFANLAWDERASEFFGGAFQGALQPSLLIQDELHLIAGPLGTLDALYEAAIEEIIHARGGVPPKIIGSTATIRNAADQVRGLYARPCYVFPSPIRRWDDAYFFRSSPTRTRRYVGIMAQGYVRPVISLVWTAAALLQGVHDVPLSDAERDAFWTLVAYHNSRRELGRTMTAARDEIQTRAGVLAAADDAVRRISRVMQLSANGTTPLDEAIRRLEAAHGSADGALDLVPSTSILSVGIDINRLALMLVNGQPKLVAEYIQATSRVGRGAVEGLVVTLFSPLKPRDRSHYEDFRSFHENLYRYVEPTSVTPLSPPARARTLHAAFIAAVRHTTEWSQNDGAASADLSDARIRALVDRIVARASRMGAAPGRDAADVKAELEAFIESWRDQQADNLVYHASMGPQFRGLMRRYGEDRGSGRPTMQSLRHVDSEVKLRPVVRRLT